MIVILEPNLSQDDERHKAIVAHLNTYPNIQLRSHEVKGQQQSLTEIYLIGDTKPLPLDIIAELPGVERVIRISAEYRVLGRHNNDLRSANFEYNGVTFGQDTLNVFAGLCAVDTPGHVEAMMRALQENGQTCTRMGAYKPRTSPYAFQGHGSSCLPYVFELEIGRAHV